MATNPNSTLLNPVTFKFQLSLFCASLLSHSHINTEGSFKMNETLIHIVLNYLNRLGLIQELNVDTALIFKVHKSKSSIQNECVDTFSCLKFLSWQQKHDMWHMKNTYHLQNSKTFQISQLYICIIKILPEMIQHIEVKLCFSSGSKKYVDKSF